MIFKDSKASGSHTRIVKGGHSCLALQLDVKVEFFVFLSTLIKVAEENMINLSLNHLLLSASRPIQFDVIPALFYVLSSSLLRELQTLSNQPARSAV
jgi:hypothetical protein